MIREPLNQFADRIVRNGEVAEFINALIEKGASAKQIEEVAAEAANKQHIAAVRAAGGVLNYRQRPLS